MAKMFEILKPITEETVGGLFPHQDDLEQVVEAAEDDSINYIPHWMVVILSNNGFLG